MNFLNRLEKKIGRYAIPGLMKYMVGCYVIGYIIMYAAPNLVSWLTLEPYMIFHQGQVWRLVSWLLIPLMIPTSMPCFSISSFSGK